MAPSVSSYKPTFVAGYESLRTLSCCNEHPTTYKHSAFKRSRLRNYLADALRFLPKEELSETHTIRSTHPWIPIHLSYNHLACLANDLGSEKATPQKIMSLSMEGYSWRRKRESYVDIGHSWQHDLFYIGGEFIQNLQSVIILGDQDYGYTEKFRNCPHSSFIVEGLGRYSSTSLVIGKLYGAGTPGSYVYLQGNEAFSIVCSICETEATCDIISTPGNNIEISYTCMRKLGTGRDFATDWTWHFLMTPYSSHVTATSDLPINDMIEKTEEHMVRFPAPAEKSGDSPPKRGSGVLVDWDWVDWVQRQDEANRVKEIEQAKAEKDRARMASSACAAMTALGVCC